MAEITVSPPDSLLKYDAPLFYGVERNSNAPAPPKGLGNESASVKLDQIVNAVLPPRYVALYTSYILLCRLMTVFGIFYNVIYREWLEESGYWVQYVSKEPASRLDIITLQELLDKRLSERKARESGLCPVREELYKQALDELIRHVTMDGPERGLLLVRIRDEIRMTVDAYKTLFDSSVVFGIKKQLRAEQGIPALEQQAAALEAENAALEMELHNLRSKLDIIEKREAERKSADDRRRKEELDFLKYQGQHLDSFLKQMNAAK